MDREERCIETAFYMINENATVRQTAEALGIPKSTVHKDLTVRLEEINIELAIAVRKVLDRNKAERHLRGGMAIKRKFEAMEQEK